MLSYTQFIDDRLGINLGDMVRQCRTSGVLFRHLIHQTCPRGNSLVGSPTHIDRVSKAFSRVVENTGKNWGVKNPLTFHGICSLSERLYTEHKIASIKSRLWNTWAFARIAPSIFW
jgi:hypothetical protein